MKESVGKLAGQVWQFLGTKGEVDVAQLARKMKVKGEHAYQGLGWLAREGKVNYQERGGKLFVALTTGEQTAFERHAARAEA